MDALEKLRIRLEKIISDRETVTRYGRVLDIPPGRDVLQVMAEEVEETRFERCVLFRNDRHEEVGLHIHAGRLMQTLDLDLHSMESAGLAQMPLSAEDPETLQALSKLLHHFCKDTVVLYAKGNLPSPELREKGLGQAQIGVTWDQIFAQDPPRMHVKPVNIESFIAKTKLQAIAFLHIKGQQVQEADGCEDTLEALLDLAEAELQHRVNEAEAGRSYEADEHCLASAGAEETQALICGQSGADMVFLVTAAAQLTDVLVEWQAAKQINPEKAESARPEPAPAPDQVEETVAEPVPSPPPRFAGQQGI